MLGNARTLLMARAIRGLGALPAVPEGWGPAWPLPPAPQQQQRRELQQRQEQEEQQQRQEAAAELRILRQRVEQLQQHHQPSRSTARSSSPPSHTTPASKRPRGHLDLGLMEGADSPYKDLAEKLHWLEVHKTLLGGIGLAVAELGERLAVCPPDLYMRIWEEGKAAVVASLQDLMEVGIAGMDGPHTLHHVKGQLRGPLTGAVVQIAGVTSHVRSVKTRVGTLLDEVVAAAREQHTQPAMAAMLVGTAKALRAADLQRDLASWSAKDSKEGAVEPAHWASGAGGSHQPMHWAAPAPAGAHARPLAYQQPAPSGFSTGGYGGNGPAVSQQVDSRSRGRGLGLQQNFNSAPTLPPGMGMQQQQLQQQRQQQQMQQQLPAQPHQERKGTCPHWDGRICHWEHMNGRRCGHAPRHILLDNIAVPSAVQKLYALAARQMPSLPAPSAVGSVRR